MTQGEYIRRSQMVTPASSVKLVRKALEVNCDSLIIDLEDAVAPSHKAQAREVIREALADSAPRSKEVGVRVNGLDTAWLLDDIFALQGVCIDSVVFPKIHSVADVHAADALLRQLDLRQARAGLTLQILIESARGLERVREIATASARCRTLIFGAGDYMADTGVAFDSRSLWYARARVAAAAAAAGLQALDHVHPDIKALDALRIEAREARDLGFSGKWAIHPAQVSVINEAFNPSAAEIERARRVIEAYQAAKDAGTGAIMLDGAMVDEAVLKIAQRHRVAAQKAGLWNDGGSP